MDFPFPDPPAPGTWAEVAPGLLWARLALPFRLDHVNVYAAESEGGWVLVDTGIADAPTRAAWTALLPRLGRVAAVLVTHHHPDHIGLAGHLCEALGVPLWTSRTSFLSATAHLLAPGLLEADEFMAFYAAHGLAPEVAAMVSTQGHRYLRRVAPLPRTHRRLAAGEALALGGRRWEVLAGEGHAPEQLMLHAAADGLLLVADQVLERITPNVSVLATEPGGDPLGDYLGSLDALLAATAPDVLALPGHRRPFRGLPERIGQLRAHHALRLDAILAAAAPEPRTVADLLPLLFPRPLDPHETGFAFSEALAHVNHLVAGGALRWEEDGGLRRIRRA